MWRQPYLTGGAKVPFSYPEKSDHQGLPVTAAWHLNLRTKYASCDIWYAAVTKKTAWHVFLGFGMLNLRIRVWFSDAHSIKIGPSHPLKPSFDWDLSGPAVFPATLWEPLAGTLPSYICQLVVRIDDVALNSFFSTKTMRCYISSYLLIQLLTLLTLY